MASSGDIQQGYSEKQMHSQETRETYPIDPDNPPWSKWWFDPSREYEWRSYQKSDGTVEYQTRGDATRSDQAPLESSKSEKPTVEPYFASYSGGFANASQPPTNGLIERRCIRFNGSKRRLAKLDPRFKVEKEEKFKIGMVFGVIWGKRKETNPSEDSDDGCEESLDDDVGREVYYRVRYFVVADARPGHSTCLAIKTYNGRATTQDNVCPEDHCIIYTKPRNGGSRPTVIRGEKLLHQTPIRVDPSSQKDSLDPKSRLDYAHLWDVEHNVKVRFIGEIHKDSMRNFVIAYNAFREKNKQVNDNSTTKIAECEANYSSSGYTGAGFGSGFGVGVASGVASAMVFVATDMVYRR